MKMEEVKEKKNVVNKSSWGKIREHHVEEKKLSEFL